MTLPPLWSHPTGRVPQRVAVVSLGVTHQDYVAQWLNRDVPDTVWGRDEVWTINRGALVFKHDLAFVMDHLAGELELYPRYIGTLLTNSAPIITSVTLPHQPANVYEYPQELVRKFFGPGHDYYHNSIPWLIAYAVAIGVKELTLWGCDYTHDLSSGREDDRANAEYWVAVARERGCQVLIPETSTLCNANQGKRWYGYPGPLE
ncbi:MAG: hypothetical protein NHG36_00445 [Chromatiaceae bacterium]|nr:hypothetical protein [Candidatus Thioaporhodococcus sediminis]